MNNPIISTYFLYARKSSESDDRQAQSIDDQVARMTEIAERLNLTVKRIFREARSAKKPDNRPIFNEMLKRIEKGEADGILTWQINRLSRNPMESGKISWMLQNGVLKAIQTSDRQYLPEDNILLFSVESGMANQYVLDLSKNVKRGLQSKLDKGWFPGAAPTGYLNKLEDHTIIVDPACFPLLRRAWDEMLTGTYTVKQILDHLNNHWGFRTHQRKRSGGKPLSESMLYKIFNDPFYKGVIARNGIDYRGSHEPMVTPEEFDRVQSLFKRKFKPCRRKHDYAFTGMIRCEECGCLVTAEKKKKYIKSERGHREYVYYHCTRRRVDVECSQIKAIRSDELERQVVELLNGITILPQFRDWAIDALKEMHAKETSERTTTYESQQKAIKSTQQQIDNLLDIRCKGMLTDEEYARKKNELYDTIKNLQEQRDTTEDRASRWLETAEQVFDFAVNAQSNFVNGDIRAKRAILTGLGQNPSIRAGKLNITPNKWLVPIAEEYPALERHYLASEPRKSVANKRDAAGHNDLILSWLPLLNKFRTVDWEEIKQQLKSVSVFTGLPSTL